MLVLHVTPPPLSFCQGFFHSGHSGHLCPLVIQKCPLVIRSDSAVCIGYYCVSFGCNYYLVNFTSTLTRKTTRFGKNHHHIGHLELTTPNHGCFVSRGCCFPREQTAGVHSNRCHHQNNNSSMPPKTKGGSRKTVNTGKDKTKVGVKPPTQKTLGFLKRKDLDVGDPDPSPDRYSHGPSVQAPAVQNVSVPPPHRSPLSPPPFASDTL